MVSALGEGDPKTKAIYRNLMASAVAPGGRVLRPTRSHAHVRPKAST